MCTSCVMFPLEVKCAFGRCYGTHHITANEVSNITMRSITSLWRSQNLTIFLSAQNDYIFRSKHDCTCDLMHLFLYPNGLINLKFYLIDLNFYLCIDKNIYLWYNNVNSFVKKQGKGILYEILLYYKSHCGQGRFC